jgi:hypothetical protein
MSKFTKWGVGTAAVLAAGSLLFGASAAQADPVNPDSGAYIQGRALNGTGSDTTQDLNNGLASVVTCSGQLVLGSWDATLPSGSGAQGATIVTHSGGTSIPRPNGSSQGVAALKATVSNSVLTNARGTSTGGATGDGKLDRTDLQFARSSSGPSSTTSTGLYSYVPLAVDAVTYAKSGSAPATVNSGLTIADLTKIYQATNGQSVSLSVGTRVIGTAANTSAQIVPLLPQTGSGTRSFFLGQIGLTEATLGSAVAWTYTSGGATVDVQEHDGSALAANSRAIVPFSIAQFIAQGNSASLSDNYGVTVENRLHGAVLAAVTVGTTAVQPTVGGVLNTAFPMARPVFTVVEHAAIATNAALACAFIDDPATTGTTEGAVYTAENEETQSFVIEDFGFGSLINRDSEVNGVAIQGITYKAGDAETFRTN